MRDIRGPTPNSTREYSPPLEGGSITVVLRNPTEAEKRRYNTVAEEKDGRIVFTDAWYKRVLTDCVVEVKDYIHCGQKIATGAELYEHGEQDIQLVVAVEAISGYSLSEQEKKPLSDSSGSTPQTTSPSDQTATSAGEKDGMRPEAVTDQVQSSSLD